MQTQRAEQNKVGNVADNGHSARTVRGGVSDPVRGASAWEDDVEPDRRPVGGHDARGPGLVTRRPRRPSVGRIADIHRSVAGGQT